MNKKSFCIANWKMNKNFDESGDFLNQLKDKDLSVSNSEIIICPSFMSLVFGYKKNEKISFGSQNVSSFKKGSYTGEVSIDMLENAHCDWVIIGHSERRKLFHENDEDIANKMNLVYKSSLNPILCIGESLKEKNNNKTNTILDKQIKLGGRRVELGEIEHVLKKYGKIDEIVVVAKKDTNGFVKHLVAFTTKNVCEEEINIIQKDCEQYLENIFFPQEFRYIKQIPTTISGKVDKVTLERSVF